MRKLCSKKKRVQFFDARCSVRWWTPCDCLVVFNREHYALFFSIAGLEQQFLAERHVVRSSVVIAFLSSLVCHSAIFSFSRLSVVSVCGILGGVDAMVTTVQGHFKVIETVTSRQHVCNFLLVVDSNLDHQSLNRSSDNVIGDLQ